MTDATILLSLLNGIAVSVFGSVLSASFCGVLGRRRNRWVFWLAVVLMLMLQGTAYLLGGFVFWRQIYPLVIHVPLLLLLRILAKRWLWPAISILSAYLFCQMRRWLALLAAFALHGGEMTQMLAELAFTLPLLLIFLRFIAPAVRQMMEYPVKTQCQFGLIPALYYSFDYLTRVYTDLLYSGSSVVLEFMPTVCCGAYLVFLLYNTAEERKRSQLRQIQDNLKLQMNQATQEIAQLRESQAATARHRHDLRHHLQYLLSCINVGQMERAKEYISTVCAEIEAQQVRHYCENEAVNLILSAFAERAENAGIELDLRGALPAVVPVGDNDLCVILSNALENALHACLPMSRAGEECTISVTFRFTEQNGRLFLQIVNPCPGEVRFEKGIPASDRPGHGIGIQSICAVVEKYSGGYTFLLEDGQFILRLFL